MNELTALDPSTGESVWDRTTSTFTDPVEGQATLPDPLVVGDVVVMIDSAGIASAIDRENGDVVWSQPGFAGMETRMAWQEGVLFILSSPEDGRLTGTGLDLDNGEPLWTIGLDGPLFQPVATNETFFYLIADEVTALSALDAEYDPIEDFSAPGSQSWVGSKASLEEDAGGSHIFAVDATTGEIIWSRSSMAGGFVQLRTGCPNSCGLTALTADGQLISPARDSGAIDGYQMLYPMVFERPPLAVSDFGFGDLGSFATLDDGTLINYGATPFNEMG
jgi:outer membrane protein assembly factor BamB